MEQSMSEPAITICTPSRGLHRWPAAPGRCIGKTLDTLVARPMFAPLTSSARFETRRLGTAHCDECQWLLAKSLGDLTSRRTHLDTATGARTFLSAASLEGGHDSTASQARSPFEHCCGQECPRSGPAAVSRSGPGGRSCAPSRVLESC